jgi:tRNA dimethylallyltransferase
MTPPAKSRQSVIFLMGPTASGKTDLAVALAQSLPCDIVSVDSAMVYRGMDIGTAKPPPEVLAQAPHRLIDICDPAEPYSAARFRADALREIATIHAQGRIPLLVGGTMLYFRALRAGLNTLPSAAPELRARLSAEAVAVGWPELHRRLAARDPATAARIHPNDAQRIQRALEIFEVSGMAPSALRAGPKPVPPWPVHVLALMPPLREQLWERLAQRFHDMMARGFLEEVAGLRARGDLSPELPSMRAVGYRQLWRHLDGHCSLDEAVVRGIYASRQYAKRQLTWLRREAVDVWLDSGTPQLVRQVRQYLDRAGLVV